MRITYFGLFRLLVFTLVVFYGCDIPNRDLVLVNKTDKKLSFIIVFDTMNLKSDFWNINDYILSGDSIYPHIVLGGKGALEYSIIKSSVDSSLYLYFTTKVIENESDIEEIIKKREYSRTKYKIDELKKANWTIRIK